MRWILGAVLAMSCVGCAGFGTPNVYKGLTAVEADRRCLNTFPPAFPCRIRMHSDGSETKTYASHLNGHVTLITWEERNGILTDVSILGY